MVSLDKELSLSIIDPEFKEVEDISLSAI